MTTRDICRTGVAGATYLVDVSAFAHTHQVPTPWGDQDLHGHDDRPGVQAVAPGKIGPIECHRMVDLTKGSRLCFVTSPLDGGLHSRR